MSQQGDIETIAKAFASQQIKAISDYIRSGINNTINGSGHKTEEHIGFELEHFIVRKSDGGYVPYLDNSQTGEAGVQTVLERLAPYYDDCVYEEESDGTKYLMGLSRKYSNITLEPGAQLEISIGPVIHISELDEEYKKFRIELDAILEELDFEIVELGYHPSIAAKDIPLLPKSRYLFMDQHFKNTGQHGICMMRASASTQVSIDFSSEDDAVQKFKIASLLSPLFAFVTDNSPIFENEPIALRGNTKRLTGSGLPVTDRMVRTAIWDDVDELRSKTMPNTFDEDFSFLSYANKIFNSPAIFSFDNSDSDSLHISQYLGETTFSELLAGQELNRSTVEHILSLFFYDVRFKTYVEIRAADAMPIQYALAFAALIKGIFYNAEALDILGKRLQDFDADDVVDAKIALREDGYDAIVYQCPAENWLDELILCANESLDKEERGYLEPLAMLIAGRKTLVDF